MQMLVGYKLVSVESGVEIASWGGTWGQCPGIPNPIMLPNGDSVHAPSLNTDYSGYTLVEWLMDEPPPTVPKSITRRQCALQLKALQMISAQEAIDMTRSGVPPAAVAAYFATLSDDDRVLAEIDFAAMNYFRDNPLIETLMTANGMTTEQTDQFFIAAAQL